MKQHAASVRQFVDSHALGRRVTLERALKVSPDAVLYAEPDPAAPADVLLTVYSEVCASWRTLVDVRFKLLGFVPAVSAALLAALLLRSDGPDRKGRAIIAVFGMVVTLGIAIYDQRNSQLHDELISRARRIEYELGITCGQFLGRPGSRPIVKHDVALAIIYSSATGAWVSAALYLLIRR